MGARQPWQIVVCPVVIFCGSITPPRFEQTNTVSVSILPETFLPRRSDAAQIIIEGFHGGSWHRQVARQDRKSTRLNSSHVAISYAVFCLKKKKNNISSNTTSITNITLEC